MSPGGNSWLLTPLRADVDLRGPDSPLGSLRSYLPRSPVTEPLTTYSVTCSPDDDQRTVSELARRLGVTPFGFHRFHGTQFRLAAKAEPSAYQRSECLRALVRPPPGAAGVPGSTFSDCSIALLLRKFWLPLLLSTRPCWA